MDYKYSMKDIVESAMLVAMAIVLDLKGLKLSLFPGGGSISLTMLPLFILAIRMGPIKGFIGIGIIYAFLACLKDGYGFEFLPFDYILGFGSIAIFGFFRKQILDSEKIGKGILFICLGALISTILRLAFSTISGMIIAGYDFVGSLVYNATYIPLSGAVSLAILLVLYKPLLIVNKRFPYKTIDKH